MSSSLLAAATAVTRFGLGARPGELRAFGADPRGWLRAQLQPAPSPVSTVTSGSAERIAAADAASRLDAPGSAVAELRAALARSDLQERARHGATTPDGFRERWTLFWTNHFAIQATGGQTEMLAGAFVREAIEPHQFGRFEDLLLAAERHPAMLIALDQVASIAPDSPVGKAEGRGLNENLAREILELHTLGLAGGYQQGDVRELALALAGWRVAGPNETAPHGAFLADPARSQPEDRRLLGRSFPAGSDQREAMLRFLARHPATYRWLAFKTARHFVADRPAPALVESLRRALEASDGSLSALARALIEAPEAWEPALRKFKTPYEHLISSYRAADLVPDDARTLFDSLSAAGHCPLWAPSARGASDLAERWATPLALVQRAELSAALARRSGVAGGLTVADRALGPLLSPGTRKILAGDLSPEDGTALALMAPEFLRR